MSLAVADLGTSRERYAKLGFDQARGGGEHYLIILNDLTVPGLFQQMVEKNIRTFNSGVGQDTGQLGDFTDIRDPRNRLVDVAIEFTGDLNPEGTEPVPITRLDPDGNPVLIDSFFYGRPSAGDSGRYDYSDS